MRISVYIGGKNNPTCNEISTGVEGGKFVIGKYYFIIKLKLENKFFNFISFIILTDRNCTNRIRFQSSVL